MTTPNPITILQNGVTSILDGINNLIPVWATTAANLDSTAQAVAQLASTAGQLQKVEVSVAQTTIPLPEEFRGVKDKAAYFILACNQYFTQTKITEDNIKIATALGLMKGDKASKWAENQLRLIQSNHADALTCWADFGAEFENHFGDRTPDTTATSKIKLLIQGTKPADEYNTDFNNLKIDTGWNECALLDRYKTGLDPDLLMSIYRCDPMPVTLKEYQKKAELLDKKAKELKIQVAQGISARRFAKSYQPDATTPYAHAARPVVGAPRPAPPAPNTVPVAAPRHDPNAMDVDHAPRRPPITCFKCGRVGHMARNCRSVVVKVVDIAEMTDEQKHDAAAQLKDQGF
ncbi:hypothetical protein D9615_009063 [Tricholomella constricta]|uniref:CCHC-type domain-containing protein n=1 Tax=Tricholomella constricta TaxID=117010 RepID=A0A8H5H002_9AGAR|nr:hypothetical protein D9615_009063 [Tricholomella constricta]